MSTKRLDGGGGAYLKYGPGEKLNSEMPFATFSLFQGKTVGGWCSGIGGCTEGCTWDRKTPVHLCGMTLRITATMQQVQRDVLLIWKNIFSPPRRLLLMSISYAGLKFFSPARLLLLMPISCVYAGA